MNPLKGFALDEIPLEIRFDPLTGHTGRVFDLPYTPPPPPDTDELVRRSREMFCPFCPEVLHTSTPLFPEELMAEGRISEGGATLIPNLLPLDTYAAVSVIAPDHYIPMEDLDAPVMFDAFRAAVRFIRRVCEVDRDVEFCYINWNYMPPAGSSLVHPHIQVNCGGVPTNLHRAQLEGSRKYRDTHGTLFWDDFIEAETQRGERVIGEKGNTFWAMSYVPQSFLPDVWCIFRDHGSLHRVPERGLEPFVEGVARILRYFAMEGIPGFNMALFSVRNEDHFRINGKVCPRLLTRPIGNSDQTYFQAIHKEPYCVRPPESVCGKVREMFEG